MKNLNSPVLAILALAGLIALGWHSQHRGHGYTKKDRDQLSQLIERSETRPVVLTRGQQLAYLYADDGGAINRRIATRMEKAARKTRGKP